MPTAIAGKVAESFGADAFHRFHRRLLEAYFAENRTVSDRAVILDVAAQVDLDADEFARRLGDDVHRDAVAQDVAAAHERGITAVPTVVVDDRYVLPGALDVAQYRRIVERNAGPGEPPG